MRAIVLVFQTFVNCEHYHSLLFYSSHFRLLCKDRVTEMNVCIKATLQCVKGTL